MDAYSAGPINDRVTYAVGGFIRQGNGFREPGFTADKGGQLTAAGSLRLDDGRLDVEFKLLNDRTAFYTGIPLNDPRNPALSLNGQLDQGTGTLVSNDFRHFSPRTFDGSTASRLDRDLADGIHTDTKQFGSTFEHSLPAGWKLINRLGAVDAKVSYDALFSGAAPQDAAAYLASNLTRAQTGFGAAVTRTGYVLANVRGGGGARVSFDPATSGGLVLESGLFAIDTSLKTVTDDLRLSTNFDIGSGLKDELVVGLYYSHFSFKQRRVQSTILTSLVNRPNALDVLAYDAAGNVVGSVTENGFTRYGNGILQGQADGSFVSPYITNAWPLTDKLTVDAGLRYTLFRESGRRYLTGTSDQGDTSTLADNNVGGLTGAFVDKSETLKGSSWTIGSAYKLADTQQLFGRVTHSVRFPRPQNVYNNQTNPVTAIQQAEGGWRTGGPLSFSVIGFWSHFNRLSLNGLVLNAQGQLVTLPLIGETQTKGVELELNWRASRSFGLNANLTLQDPRTKSLFNVATGLPAANTNDKQIQSIPKVLASVQPVFYAAVGGIPFEVSATASHVGQRFVDYANSTALPAYTTVDLSLLASLTSAVDFALQVRNAGNSHGLTEGNPRTDSLTGQGTPTAIYGRPIFGRNFQASLTYRW